MPSVIGLNIETSAFRAVELSWKNKGKSCVLERALDCPDCMDSDNEKAADNLRNFIKDAKFSTKSVVLALPERNVFSTILNAPFNTEKEVKSYLEIQGGKIFPKPLSDLVYSFVILGPSVQKKGETDVNIVASGKDYVAGLLNLAKKAGLNVLSMESEAYAIVRALLRSQKLGTEDALLAVNVGLVDADMMVIQNGYVRFSRNISLGGITFTKAISQALNIPEEQAEEYMKSYGFDETLLEGKIINAMRPVAQTLITEVKRTVDFYSTRNPSCSFQKIIYCGGSAVMPGLLAFSAENLGMEVEIANPFVNMTFSPKIASQRENLINTGPVYTVSTGLALKEVV